MPSCYHRARQRLTHPGTGPFGGRRDQAHRRRQPALPQGILLLPMIAAAGLLLVSLPGEVARATPPWTWVPLPATAFESIQSPTELSMGLPHADRAPASAPARTSVGTPAVLGPSVAGSSGNPNAARPLEIVPPGNRAERDDSTAAGSSPTAGSRPVIAKRPDIGAESAPIQPATSSAAPKGPIHVVASGDNLWTIARRHAADLASILRWNRGLDPDRLVAGQRVLVPGGTRMAPLPRAPRITSRVASPSVALVRPAAPSQIRQGDHLWPLAVRGDLSRRFSGAHPGIDIAAPLGTKVRAIADGTVVWAGWKDNGGGYVVEIAHPDGMRSTYNHNSKVTVERGDKVAQGDTIALVGSTGWATGPHLDLRVRMGGRPVDPLSLY